MKRRYDDGIIEKVLLAVIAALVTGVLALAIEFTRDVKTILSNHEQRLDNVEKILGNK